MLESAPLEQTGNAGRWVCFLAVPYKIVIKGVYVHVLNYVITLQNPHKYHNVLTNLWFYNVLYLYVMCIQPCFPVGHACMSAEKIGEAFAVGYAIKWEQSYWASVQSSSRLYQQCALALKQERRVHTAKLSNRCNSQIIIIRRLEKQNWGMERWLSG